MTNETRTLLEAVARQRLEKATEHEQRAGELETEAAALRQRAAAARAVAEEIATLWQSRGAK